MGLVLSRAWEQFWHTQSFPLNVTLSPMGNGFLHQGQVGRAQHCPGPAGAPPKSLGGEDSPAGAADKALGVVGPAQG